MRRARTAHRSGTAGPVAHLNKEACGATVHLPRTLTEKRVMGGSASHSRRRSSTLKTSSSTVAAANSVEKLSCRFGRGSPTWPRTHASARARMLACAAVQRP